MNILVTGAKGFVGRNLVVNLYNLKENKNRTRPGISIDEIYEYDMDSTPEELDEYCRKADFVFNLAGVNRPKDPKEFQEGNFGFASTLLDTLKKHQNKATVMLSSSIQATLQGRFGTSEYGLSKKAGEDLFFAYGKETGARVLVYRFPNLVGKWVRPNYNSAVGTFCHNIAHDLPIQVNDPSVELEMLFIDDLVEEMFDALEGKEHHCEFDGVETVLCPEGRYCAAPVTHKATLGRIVELLHTFHEQPRSLVMPEIAPGSFTELLKTEKCGQFSVNISKPGITKGQHWHNSKWEFFIVVAGHGLIQERKIGTDEVIEFEVSGDKIEAVHMLPGYTHNIINLSDTENLVTVMWANEQFDPEHPDTFGEPV